MKKCLTIFLILFMSLAAGKGLYWSKGGFTLAKVSPLRATPFIHMNEEAEKILDQEFSYLGSGRQCFAFVSQDGEYVLKLPRTDIYRNPLWLRTYPFSNWGKSSLTERLARKKFVLDSVRLASADLKEETAILAVHLGKTTPKGQFLILKDRIGRTYRLKREKTSFILQKKEPILTGALLDTLKENREEAKKIVLSFLHLISKINQKGIANKDMSFLKNYAYDGKRAFQIDVGSFYPAEAGVLKDFRAEADPVQAWLKEIDPELEHFFSEELDKITSVLQSEAPKY